MSNQVYNETYGSPSDGAPLAGSDPSAGSMLGQMRDRLASLSDEARSIRAQVPYEFEPDVERIQQQMQRLGERLSDQNLDWQDWPDSAVRPEYITIAQAPDALTTMKGSVARSEFFVGEPIREARLIKATGSGYMAAILPSGMRAVSTEISPETGAGGFILPNDRVDVILSRRDREA